MLSTTFSTGSVAGGGGGGFGAGGSTTSDSSAITSWVAAHYTARTVDGVTIYDLTVTTR